MGSMSYLMGEGSNLVFPEWTEMQINDQDAIQYLRLNELRDSINEVLFPYLTTVTPYFRIVSWLTWIYNRLEHEMSIIENMTISEYNTKSLRYYGIFAVAHVLYGQTTGEPFRGPVGVQTIEEGLAKVRNKRINFNLPRFGKPANPVSIYKSSLISMNLLEERQQPISPRRYQSILIPTRHGKVLANEFESQWSKSFEPDSLTRKMVWSVPELTKLGRLVFLQGVSTVKGEVRLLMKSARNSIKIPDLYEDFVDLVTKVAMKCNKLDVPIDYADISKVSLYRELVKENHSKPVGISLKNSQATALLAYHELHTHTSYGAEAILDGLTRLATVPNNVGISITETINKVHKIFTREIGAISKNHIVLEDIFREIEKSFSKGDEKYQYSYPRINGKFGFETIQKEIYVCENSYRQIALGLVILLQSAVCQRHFDSSWLEGVLANHRNVFSAHTLFEEYQTLQQLSPIEWTKSMIELIIEKHDDVARSKGLYAKRFDFRGDRLFFRADAGFSIQRGRLSNAFQWLSDIGILQTN